MLNSCSHNLIHNISANDDTLSDAYIVAALKKKLVRRKTTLKVSSTLFHYSVKVRLLGNHQHVIWVIYFGCKHFF